MGSYSVILTLPANQVKVSSTQLKLKKPLVIAIDGKVYDIVYTTLPSNRQVRYKRIDGFSAIGTISVNEAVGFDRKVYVLIKK